MSEQKWLLLDFDNTLMETEKWVLPSLIKRFNDLYRDQIDHPLELDEFKEHFHGQGGEVLCNNLSKHFNITVGYSTLYKDRELFVMRHLQSLPDGVAMAPNLLETLQILQADGFKFAFVSNNPIQRAQAAMRCASNSRGAELARFLACHCFEADSKNKKPLPDVYNNAMEQLRTTPAHAYAIEDSVTGLTAARAAGLKVLAYGGFDDGEGQTSHKDKMLANGAVAWFDDWAQLPALLKTV